MFDDGGQHERSSFANTAIRGYRHQLANYSINSVITSCNHLAWQASFVFQHPCDVEYILNNETSMKQTLEMPKRQRMF